MADKYSTSIDLHVHPFLENYSLRSVIDAMDARKLDVLGLEILDASIYPRILKETQKHYPTSLMTEEGIRLLDGKYILNAREYNTREGFHILTIGYSLDDADKATPIRTIIDEGLRHDALVLLDHPFIDNGKTRTAGHISEQMEQDLELLCKEYSGQIALEWNGYCIPWIRRVLKAGLNTAGFKLKYHDVNKKAEDLSVKLKEEGYNLPVIADTDLHGRGKRQLKAMGTARILTDIEGETPKEIISSLKHNVFEGSYQNVCRYVSSMHLLGAFCLPIIFPFIFKKPRS